MESRCWVAHGYFYPRSPCGERHRAGVGGVMAVQISIHALLAESDGWSRWPNLTLSAISIHALLAESDVHRCADVVCAAISIHALLAESDLIRGFVAAQFIISIHALLAESDHLLRQGARRVRGFLSTLSLRRATFDTVLSIAGEKFLSTLSLRRATTGPAKSPSTAPTFLSTLSLRRATT